MTQLKSWLIGGLLVATVLVLLAFGAAVSFGRAWIVRFAGGMQEILDQRAGEVVEHVDAWLEDAAWFNARFPDVRAGRSNDAGHYLNERLPWIGPGADDWSASLPVDLRRRLAFPQGTDSVLGARWPEVSLAELELEAVDLTWLRELSAFDHWNPISPGPRVPRGMHAAAVGPDLRVLLNWARVRFLVARERGDPLQAVREVRHLRDLLLSTEMLSHMMVAARLMEVEAEAFAAAPWPVDTPADAPSTSDEALRVRRMIRAAPAFFELGAPEGARARIIERTAGSVPFCMGLEEGCSMATLLRPVETSTTFGPDLQDLRRLAEMTSCRWPRAKDLWSLQVDDLFERYFDDLPLWGSIVARAVLLFDDAKEASAKPPVVLFMQNRFELYRSSASTSAVPVETEGNDGEGSP